MNNPFRFCPHCATPLVPRITAGRARPVCPACGYVHYEHLKVCAAVIARQDGQVLLVRRSHPPFAGDWNLPAGYVEIDESPEHAAVREAKEEAGLDVSIDGVFGLYFFDDDPRGNGLLIVYLATVTGGVLRSSAEGRAAFFPPDALPENIAGAGHRPALSDWRAGLEPSGRLQIVYCPRCAHRMSEDFLFGRTRPRCPSCGFIFFRDPKVGAGVFLEHEGRVLLTRRGIVPEPGKWCLPAGFIEYDESPEAAAVREAKEETGLDVELDGILGIHAYHDDLRGRGILILYRARLIGGTLTPSDETTEVRFFARDELPPPEEIAFRTHRQVLAEWRSLKSHVSGLKSQTKDVKHET